MGYILDKKRILIVEDEVIIALELQKQLEMLGYLTIGIAKDYYSAIKQANSENPDIILMDINLGSKSKDGIETAIEIGKSKNIPIIYCSGNTEDSTFARANETFMLGYITKPYSFNQIKSVLGFAELKIKEYEKELSENPLGEVEEIFSKIDSILSR